MRNTNQTTAWANLGLMVGLILLTTGCREAPASEAQGQLDPVETTPEVRVQVATASLDTFERPVTLSGVSKANRRAMLSADVPGRVVDRGIEVGQEVEEGEELLRLDTTHIRLDVRQADANVAARRTDVEFANQELQRATQLFEAGAQSGRIRDQASYNAQKALDGLRLAQATQSKAYQAVRDTRVRAPFGGVIAECQVDEGDTVGPGRPIISLVDLSQIRVVVGVTAEDTIHLQADQEATVTLEALGGLELSGRLHHIGPSPDRMSGTYPAEFVIENPDGQLREGMVAHVSLPSQPRESLLIPQSAVLRVGGSPRVFVIAGPEGEELVRRQDVRLGASADGRVEVLEGLEDGDRVVTEGLFALSDGARVEIDGLRAE